METKHLDPSLFKIDSWAKILRGSKLFPDEMGYNLLIKGLPGTGKTSLGLSILYRVCNEGYKAKLVTLVEPANQIIEKLTKKIFSLDFKGRLAAVDTTHRDLDTLGFLDDMATESEVKYLMIDGVSILKYQTENLKTRTKRLIDRLRERKVSTILISEETIKGEDRFFEYLVDGIINLSVEGVDRQRFLEITKMRYVDYVAGKHAFDFREDKGKIDLVIYPSIRCYLNEKATDKNFKPISSGIKGFEKLIKGSSKTSTFDPGDVVLVMGEPGSGKTLFCLEFINAIQNDNEEIGVWISLEDNLEEFREYTEHFCSEEGCLFGNLLENKRFKFIHFDPSNLLLDEFSSAIMAVLQKYKVSRLVIDSLSILERKFQTQNECIEYLSALIETLKKKKAVSMLTYGISRYFQPLGKLEIFYNPDVDIIVHLRNYDINNALVRALGVIKSRGKEYSSLLRRVKITKEKGLYLTEEGWTRIGLLAGKPEDISEARLFFKYFYQNYSTKWIDEKIFEGFKKRYSENETFKIVGRSHPSPDHWSFQGYGGPGHSNTKVVSLKKYIIDRLRDNNVLLSVPDDVLGDNVIQRQFKSGFLWKDKIGKGENSQMVPLYADLGVLCYQGKYSKFLFEEMGYPTHWKDLIKVGEDDWQDKIRVTDVKKKINYFFVMPSLATDLGNFMGFFLEILWAHGKGLFPCDEDWSYSTHNKKNKKEFFVKHFEHGIMSKEFLKTLIFLRDLVDKKVCPDPRREGHYHQALFSRRWYSKIEQYPIGDEKRPDYEKEQIDFSIAPLPIIDDTIGSFSALEVYCAGIIKGALAPETGWMFIKELASYYADTMRIDNRRGIPMDEKLCLAKKGNEDREKDFRVIRDLLGIGKDRKSEKPMLKVKSNVDIPYYYDIESIIAPEVENIFDEDDERLKERQGKIFNKVKRFFDENC